MGEWIRPKGATVLPAQDANLIKAEVARLGAKRVLEFGPGESTELLASLGVEVTTCEHVDKWLEVAKERFANTPNVKVLKYLDEIPVKVEGLRRDAKFDLAFVDGPQGYAIARKVHPGYADCSRFNTCLFALQRAPIVLLHDSSRPLEKGTLGRLHTLGFEFEQSGSLYGTARIWHSQNQTSQPAS